MASSCGKARLIISAGRRVKSTLSARQIEDVASTEVRFPLYEYLRDMQQAQTAALRDMQQAQTAFSKDLNGMREEISNVRVKIANLPLVLLGGSVALAALARQLGFFEPSKGQATKV